MGGVFAGHYGISHLMTLTCISSPEDVSQQIQMLQAKILLKGQVENALSGSRNRSAKKSRLLVSNALLTNNYAL